MSGTSSYNAFESEDESTGWLMTSETSLDDGLSDELTLLNGDEDDCDEDTLSFEALIKLSMRLKKKYNLREATVALERCDKIWDTMQLVKKIQMDYEGQSALLGGDDADADDETEPDRKPSRNNSRSPEKKCIPYIKYQPVQGVGNNALPNFYLAVKSQKKLYNCLTCGKQYGDSRSLLIHSQRSHGVYLPKAPKKRRRSADNTTQVGNNRSSSRENSQSRSSKHNLDNGTKKKYENESIDVRSSPTRSEKAKSTNDKSNLLTYACSYCDSSFSHKRSLTAHLMNAHDMTLQEAQQRYGKKKKKTKQFLKDYKYVWTCKPCGCKFKRKHFLRVHMIDTHDIAVPDVEKRRKDGEIVKDYGYYTSEVVKKGKFRTASSSVEGVEKKRNDKTAKKPKVGARTTRSGRTIGSPCGVDRPRRACATTTSYRECTKEEEEMLQRALTYGNNVDDNPKNFNNNNDNDNGQKTSPCFLCKKGYVDIRKHLIDYHRINSPDMIIPMTEKVVGKCENNENSIANLKNDDNSSTDKKIRRERECSNYDEKTDATDDNSQTALSNDEDSNEKDDEDDENVKIFQCVTCLWKFTRSCNLKRHVEKYTKGGVLIDHLPPRQLHYNLIGENVSNEPIVDPLSLTDSADSSTTTISDARGESSNHRQANKKRRASSSDESATSDRDEPNKRRKIEEKFISVDNADAEFIDETIDRNEDAENPISTSDNECEVTRDNEKSLENCNRDARDSSDRDSGIGIGITTKKQRTSSYIVVDKGESGDDEKSKDYETSKDENTCSDTSSGVTNVDFANDDGRTGSREISESLDCVDDDVYIVENLGINCHDEDNAFGEKFESDGRTTNDGETDYCWTKNNCYDGKQQCNRLSDFARPEQT